MRAYHLEEKDGEFTRKSKKCHSIPRRVMAGMEERNLAGEGDPPECQEKRGTHLLHADFCHGEVESRRAMIAEKIPEPPAEQDRGLCLGSVGAEVRSRLDLEDCRNV